ASVARHCAVKLSAFDVTLLTVSATVPLTGAGPGNAAKPWTSVSETKPTPPPPPKPPGTATPLTTSVGRCAWLPRPVPVSSNLTKTLPEGPPCPITDAVTAASVGGPAGVTVKLSPLLATPFTV